MQNTIRNIFEKKVGEEEHSEFVKFSRGLFTDKYLIEGKKQKNNWVIKTSAEFANYLVRKCLEKLNQEEKVSIKGIIVSTRKDLESEIGLPVDKMKQFAGVRQAMMNTEVEASDLLKLIDKMPKAFFALSFSAGGNDLKIKAKPPKSAKPSTKGEEKAKADFCTLKTSDKEIISDLFFDYADSGFNEISINHTLEVLDIKLPKGVTDPVELREKALRKGRIIRSVNIDSKQYKKETDFEV